MAFFRRFATGRSLSAISAIAVLIPTATLFWRQYRSLDQMRARTRLVARDQVRQGLELLQQRLEEQVATIAADSLGRINPTDFAARNLNATAVKFRSILEKYQPIGHIFAVMECACAGEPPAAVLSTKFGAEGVKYSRFTEPVISDALRAHRGARGLPKDGESADLLYFQSDLRPVLYTFRYFPGPMDKGIGNNFGMRSPKDSGRWAGLEIQAVALLHEVVPKVLAELKRHSSESMGELAFAVTENGLGTVFSTTPGLTGFETVVQAGSVFPFWTFAGRHQGPTIENLAQEQFQRGLALSGLVVCCLVLAIGMSFRAVAREAKLAELKSGFVSNVSHEMKTPLALIRVFAETLELGRVTDPSKLREYYRVIHSESQRLTQLIDNVLDFSRMESGRKQYQFATADLTELVSEVLKPYEQHIRASGFSLRIDLADSLPPVLVDREAISQAVLNLVDNALKYSPSRKELVVRVWKCGKEVAIQVADQGVGIPESEQQRIFEKFYRVNTGLLHDTKGSGLGLTLTKHIVEAHGGRIEVDSKPGSGSRFTILLRISAASSEPQARLALPGEPLAENSHR
jgi:signal transduction histidine kinase